MQSVYQIKQEMCEIGRRLYNRGFAAANDGNITYRISDNEVLCTPTLICKGFMKPDDICSVDMEGKQLSGKRKRTSEVLLHLAIMKERPDVKSCVHCHPPHATAFAIAREPIPQCVLPEVEVFLGEVPLAKYETPGGQKFADTVLPYCRKSNVIILTNHGTVSFGESLERAYWWTEILDAYCRMLILARDLGRVSYLSEGQTRELLDLKAKWGFKDSRNEAEMKDCDICANDLFRSSWADSGVQERAFVPPSKSASAGAANAVKPASLAPSSNGAPHDQEALVQMITDRVMAALAARS
ncbi:MAG: class II aldolase/adducin family protein [Pirellulales bacterium]|nr:class II aldolase/adducin family protein [Pirellulales bacterium]